MLSQSSQQKTQLVAVGGFGQASHYNIIISQNCYKSNPSLVYKFILTKNRHIS